MGHWSYNCQNDSSNTARVSMAENTEENNTQEENFVYMAWTDQTGIRKSEFLLDGAATIHLVETWVNLENEITVSVKVKGLGSLNAIGKGILWVDGLCLGKALRVPGLGVNLISEGLLQQEGCKIISDRNWRKIFYEGEKIIEAQLEKGLFVWRPNDQSFMTSERCLMANFNSSSKLQLWHLRMGHLPKESLLLLQKQSTGIEGIGTQNINFCIPCCRAKGKLRSFTGQVVKAQQKFQTIFMDLWGPMQPSLSGATYALLIVDEYTSYTWGYFIQCKSQAENCISAFIMQQHRQGHNIQHIRTDKGGEFMSNSLKSIFQQQGITHITSPAFTPQFQGKVERMNRTIGEMAHALRANSNLGVEFWSLSWETAIFLRNRSPTTTNDDHLTPYELMTGQKPRLKNMRIFGCTAEAYIHSAARKKDEDRTVPGLFVGYDDNTRSYKFIPNGKKKWIAVRTLMCDEQKYLQREEESPSENWEMLETSDDNMEGNEMKENANKKCDDVQQIAEEKEEQRPIVHSKKSAKMVTRSQLRRELGEVAMVAVNNRQREFYDSQQLVELNTPKHIGEAFAGPDSDRWKLAVADEMESINKAETLSEPVQLPTGQKAVNLKFIFTKKMGETGKIDRYKARLVYNHLGNGNEDEDNFSPVVNKVGLRIFLSAVASHRWELIQADVKTAFLNADNPGLEYVKLPKLIVEREEDRIRILKKALYGLQRAPKMWHQTFSDWATQIGYVPSEFDQCMFIHSEKQQMMIIYVDDILMAAENAELIEEMCGLLMSRFESRVMGVPSYFLGMNILYNKDEGILKMYQKTYIDVIVKNYELQVVLPKSLPMEPGTNLAKNQSLEQSNLPQYGSLIGALLFLAVSTRPDISFAVGTLSKFVANPTEQHWKAAINLVGYLKKTTRKGLVLGDATGNIVGYADSDWGNDVDDRMSVSGGIVYWGASVISWFSRKQSMVSLSTAEAESHAMVDVGKEIIYVQRMVKEMENFFGIQNTEVPILYTDNQPAIDSILHNKGRTKHYDLRIKFLSASIAGEVFRIRKVASVDNLADILTKILRNSRFRMLSDAIVLDA
jgi:hypothetical protein